MHKEKLNLRVILGFLLQSSGLKDDNCLFPVTVPKIIGFSASQHLIPALNAWAAPAKYMTARPIATYFPGD